MCGGLTDLLDDDCVGYPKVPDAECSTIKDAAGNPLGASGRAAVYATAKSGACAAWHQG